MALELDGTASAANAIQRVRYTHDLAIDLILARPDISQNEMARQLGFRPAWMSRVINSDAFKARLALRKADLVDAVITESFMDRVQAAADQSLEILTQKLERNPSFDDAVKVFEITTKAKGYGASPTNITTQNNFVVPLPMKARSAEEWAAAARLSGAEAGATELSLVEEVRMGEVKTSIPNAIQNSNPNELSSGGQ